MFTYVWSVVNIQYFLAEDQGVLKRKIEEAQAARQAQPPAKKQMLQEMQESNARASSRSLC